MRVAVVGHVEWVEFARVPAVPAAGDIVTATSGFEEPGGGGGVAAVQLAKLAGECLFLTALGDDSRGREAAERFAAAGVRVECAWRAEPQRRAFVFLDDAGERTITVIGDKLVPRLDDPLPWDELSDCDAVFFVAGDRGALEAARGARVLAATPRDFGTVGPDGIGLDAVIGSGRDPAEHFDPASMDPPPRLTVATHGALGGQWREGVGEPRPYEVRPVPGEIGDAYGCGDSFAAGVTWALGRGLAPREAIGVGAQCGAACLTGHGPFAGQLTAADLSR